MLREKPALRLPSPFNVIQLYDSNGKDQIMPSLTRYQQSDFPVIYKWQAIAFMRCEWSSIFEEENLYMPETYAPELEPVHFAVAEGDSLLSYGALLRLNLIHAGHDYAVYGFGNMLTFPP